MASVPELMHANLLEVFNERDGERRRAAIERTYTPDVKFFDPEGITTGRDALDAKAGQLLDQSPSFVFSPAGPVIVNHDLGYLAWNLGPQGSPPVVRGVDIAFVADGVITTIYTQLLSD